MFRPDTANAGNRYQERGAIVHAVATQASQRRCFFEVCRIAGQDLHQHVVIDDLGQPVGTHKQVIASLDIRDLHHRSR